LITRTALHARCAIVVPSAKMSVRNYAGSGIKRATAAISESALPANLFALFVYRPILKSTDTGRRAGLSAIAELLIL